MEYELLDTGVFNDDRYFDVFVEYAKAAPEDILVEITAANRGAHAAELHLLPTLWFRNDWSSWIAESNRAPRNQTSGRSSTGRHERGPAISSLLGESSFPAKRCTAALHRNETTTAAFPRAKDESPYVKDGINDCVVQGRQEAVNPGKQGTRSRHTTRPLSRRSDQSNSPAALQKFSRPAGQTFWKQFDEILRRGFREPMSSTSRSRHPPE